MGKLTKPSNDPFGAAVSEYYNGKRWHKIKVKSNIAVNEVIKPSYLFREYYHMPDIEQIALNHSMGKILDVGACAGSHALCLQENGKEVTALEISAACCEVMKQRGVKNVINSDFYNFSQRKYNTLLFLMNGIGISGTIANLGNFLQHCKSLIKEDGQIIFDSSDISYLYNSKDGSKLINLNSTYYGEIKYQIRYRKTIGDWFDWLFIDPYTMEKIAGENGFNFRLPARGMHYDYLGVLKLK